MITLDKVSKEFLSRDGARIRALDGVSFHARRAGITCIVGPTGSGKSTVLRAVAGLEQADSGSVLVEGQAPSGRKGGTGYLTQRHTLFPWMRVRENIGLPLTLREGLPRETVARVAEISALLGLSGSEDLFPHELSGGMQQRAALGRLLASDAGLWLMDEPFTALDERTRHQIQQLLVDLAHARLLTVLFVTHSIDEAVFLADRIVVLSAAPGRVVSTVDVPLPRPRNRLDPAYGTCMEQVRTSIESVL
jgi:ABC-type nitrate/sulfonate/bicarbonate transport system ATPase subunit